MGILRFLLAISVVLAHSSSIFGFVFVGGQIAVQAFYIISGFYMALILNEKYIGVNGSYKLFITNRFLRIYPIYWIILLLTISFSLFIFVYSHGNNTAKFTSYITYMNSMNIGSFVFLIFTNLFIFFQDLVLFLGLNTLTGNLFFTPNFIETNPLLYTFIFIPQGWTVGVELTFYLIAPFLVKRKIQTIIVFILLSLLLRFLLYYNGFKDDPWSYRFFPTELVFFILGIISYKIYIRIRDIEVKIVHKIMFATVLIGTLFLNFIPIQEKYFLFLFLFFICLPFIFVLTKNWKTDSYIGELSYPIYISHMFVLSLINAFNVPAFGSKGLTLSIVTVFFSLILNECISKKIEKMRQKRVIKLQNVSKVNQV